MHGLNSNTFRTNALTVIGSIGYVVAFGIAIAEVLAGDPVPIKLITVLLLASAAALGVDFGLDFLPVELRLRESDGDTNNDTNDNTNDEKREGG